LTFDPLNSIVFSSAYIPRRIASNVLYPSSQPATMQDLLSKSNKYDWGTWDLGAIATGEITCKAMNPQTN
jgi:hypothetical protein